MKSFEKKKASKVTFKYHHKHEQSSKESRNALKQATKDAESTVSSFHQR